MEAKSNNQGALAWDLHCSVKTYNTNMVYNKINVEVVNTF